MSQSLVKIKIHLVFSTKNREALLVDNIREEMHRYQATVLHSLNCPVMLINSVPDHVHVLFELGRTVPLSVVVSKNKTSSSHWIKTKDRSFQNFSWQTGYGAFAVSESQGAMVKKYIAEQEKHHRKTTFQEEYVMFLRRHRVQFDERYVWE